MERIGDKIRKLREDASMPLRKLASLLDLDQSTLSKIERGTRQANKQLVEQIADIFEVDKKELLVSFYSDKVLYELQNEDFSLEILKLAEEKVTYLKQNQV